MLTGNRGCNLTVNKQRCPANGRKSSTLLSMPLGLFPAVLQDGNTHYQHIFQIPFNRLPATRRLEPRPAIERRSGEVRLGPASALGKREGAGGPQGSVEGLSPKSRRSYGVVSDRGRRQLRARPFGCISRGRRRNGADHASRARRPPWVLEPCGDIGGLSAEGIARKGSRSVAGGQAGHFQPMTSGLE